MGKFFEFIIHLDKHIGEMVRLHGTWSYAILFGIVFAETGFIVLPFLPGDSLLFVLGILAGPETHLDVLALFGLLTLAAIIGDQLNFRIGRIFGMRLYRNPKSKIFKPAHLQMTHEFYEKYGHKTVLLARFVPVVRALSPFVAGMSGMPYRDFCAWSVGGATLWVSVCLFGGYFFGRFEIVKNHFDLGLLVIVLFSIIPAIIEFVRHRNRRRKAPVE